MSTKFFIKLLILEWLKAIAIKGGKYSWLATGPTGSVVSFILGKALDHFINNTVLSKSVMIMDFETDELKEAYLLSVQTVYKDLSKKKRLTEEEKYELEEDLIEAHRGLIHVNKLRVKV